MDLDAVAVAAGVAAFVELRLAVRGIAKRVAKLEKDKGGDDGSGAHKVIRFLPWAMLALFFVGCSSTRTSSASVERTTGRHGDQVVDLTTIRREQSEAQTAVELAPVVNAAVAAAMGDVRGALRELAARPVPPTTDQLEQLLRSDEDGQGKAWGLGGAAGGLALLALREWAAHRRTRQSEDEAWEEIRRRAAAAPAPTEKG